MLPVIHWAVRILLSTSIAMLMVGMQPNAVAAVELKGTVDGKAELFLDPVNTGKNTLKGGSGRQGQSVQVDVRDAAAVGTDFI